MPPVKKPCVMTSYGGIIRIRLKGRSSVTSSQPANTSSPVFTLLIGLYMIYSKKARTLLQKSCSCCYAICSFCRNLLFNTIVRYAPLTSLYLDRHAHKKVAAPVRL